MKTFIKRLCVAALIAGGGLLPLGRVAAQTFTNLHNFDSGLTNGGVPGAMIISNNVLYGTSFYGGSANNGTVFKLNSDGTGYTNLYSFSPDFPGFTNSDGANPGGGYVLNSTLVLSGGALYGTAMNGGRFGRGTIFKINVDGTGFTNLHNFAGSEGTTPNAGLILSGDMLYGAAANGAAAGLGTIFKLTTNGTGFTVLHEFSNTTGDLFTNSDGGQPVGGLLLSGGTLYGTAQAGGTLGCGTLFAVNTDGLGFTNLHNFDIAAANPSSTLILSGSVLYGTAYSAVFAINTNGSGYTNLFTFEATSAASPFTNSTGVYPTGGLILSGNALYGTASAGGSFGNGTVFAVNTNGTGFVNLFDFPGPSGVPPNIFNNAGANPSAGLVLSGNTLYGTADAGGASGYGTVFSLTLPPPPPLLTIVRSGANVVLMWPTNGVGFTLQATTNLTANAWSIVSPAQTVSGTNYVVTNAISGSAFYRLSRL